MRPNLIVALLILAAAGSAAAQLSPDDPRLQGRTLGYWTGVLVWGQPVDHA